MRIHLAEIEREVKNGFLEIGDTLEILPTYGRKKNIKLNRTLLDIRVEKGFHCKIHPLSITLPIPSGDIKDYQLIFRDDVFVLNSISGHPFLINGQYCFSSILQKNDKIEIGYNKISCRKETNLHTEITEILPNSDLNILIEGETGVGKSRMAKKIHEKSGRLGDYVHLNLSSFPHQLIESELFGHKKGSFTGAINDKEGALIMANGGTLFLDEIDSLSLELQVKLLLFLDDLHFRPVGSNQNIKCDTNLIFAAGRDLRSLVEEGSFRRDLYFRISSGFKVKIKPLREDEGKLKSILQEYEKNHHVLLDPKLVKLLHTLPWPGNIRQLLGVLERKRIMTKGNRLTVDEDDFDLCDLESVKNNHFIPFKELKKRYFEKAYYSFDCNVQLAAKKIGVSQTTLYKFIHSA